MLAIVSTAVADERATRAANESSTSTSNRAAAPLSRLRLNTDKAGMVTNGVDVQRINQIIEGTLR